jgi:hypothetical protein
VFAARAWFCVACAANAPAAGVSSDFLMKRRRFMPCDIGCPLSLIMERPGCIQNASIILCAFDNFAWSHSTFLKGRSQNFSGFFPYD